MYIEILVEKDSYEIVHTKSAGNLGAESNLRNEQLEEGRRGADQKLRAGSRPAGNGEEGKLCILFSTFIKRTFLGKHPHTNATIS